MKQLTDTNLRWRVISTILLNLRRGSRNALQNLTKGGPESPPLTTPQYEQVEKGPWDQYTQNQVFPSASEVELSDE